MCGIAGIVWKGSSPPGDLGAPISAMLDSMPYRGPDARGVWSNPRHALGGLRLSIIDPDTASNQPMSDEAGRVLAFNGEIYNYIELRKEIGSRYRFRTNGDTEVILAAYEIWGTDCVSHFNGDWAFALFDPTRDLVFLSRDRFGIKPLYVYADHDKLMFASETRALLRAGAPREVDVADLRRAVRFRKTEFRYSNLLKGVKPLEPGTSMIVEPGKTTKLRYYSPDDLFAAPVPNDFLKACDAFGDLLQDAVRLRLRSDVPVGVLLSGGLDSSTIASLVASETDQPVMTYAAVFPSSEADESAYSELVASTLSSHHMRIEPSADDFFRFFERVVEAQGGAAPSARFVARDMTYERAGQDVVVVLEGQGGDELFGGYEACYRIYRSDLSDRLGTELEMHVQPQGEASSLLPLAELEEGLKVPYKEVTIQRIDPPAGLDRYTSKQVDLLANNLLSLLHTGDHLQMHHSIEGRYPLLDHRLVEFCFSAPVEFRILGKDKRMMREWVSSRGLVPPEIVARTDKKGFSSSHEYMLRGTPRGRELLARRLGEELRARPGVFDPAAVDRLLNETNNRGVVERLLTMLSLLIHMRTESLALVGP